MILMTGPGEGKIPIKVDFYVEDVRVACTAYIHVKGYLRARVTHLDIEEIEAYPKNTKVPAVIIGRLDGVTIILMKKLRINGIECRKLRITGISLIGKGKRSGGYVGVKEGGIYIGFRREIIDRLEEIARKLNPELFKGGRPSIDSLLT